MANIMDINNVKERTDINDENKQTDINSSNELTNINNVVNGQMDINNTNGHISTCIDIKVRIYFSQNAINLDFKVTNKLQIFFLKLRKLLCINFSVFHIAFYFLDFIVENFSICIVLFENR